MADRITQTLGFDAQQAIATLGNLQKALSGVNRQLLTLNKRTAGNALAGATTSFQQAAKQAAATTNALQNTAGQFQKTGVAGKNAGAAITVSWQTMLRVVQTQILVRGLNQLTQLFGSTADSAKEFQLQIARISAISEGPGSSIRELSASVNQLSVDLGVAVEKVGTAAFEALQNNLGSTAETMDFLGGSVSKLSLLFGSDLVDGVNTVSPILKAYNLDISEADRISDLLFTTIKTGVITMDDLANQLGKTVPFATQLGVSLEDLFSSISAITLQGTDAATAQTQFRNILIKLIKPTEALAVAFEKLGVSSGQELIDKFGGVVPALKALSDSVSGSEEAIARMFNTSRAAAGALNLLANSGAEQARIAEEMANNFGIVNKEFAKFDETPARRAEKASAKLAETLRTLGDTTLEIRTQFTETFNSIVRNGEDARVVLLGLTTAVVGLGVAALVAFPALVIPAAVVGAVVALTAGVLALKHAYEDLTDVAGNAAKAQEEALKRGKEIADENFKVTTSRLREENQIRKDLQGEFLSDVTDNFDKEKALFDQRAAHIIQQEKNVVKALKTTIEDSIKAIQDFAQNSQKTVTEQANTTKDALDKLDDFKFDREIGGKSTRSQAFAVDERAAQKTREAIQALDKADREGNEAARERALAELNAADAINQRASALSKQSGLLGKSENAEDRRQEILEKIAKSEVARLDKVKQAAALANGERVADETATLQKLAQLAEERQKLQSELQDTNTTPERREEIQSELATNAQESAKTFADAMNSELLKKLDIAPTLKKAFTDFATSIDTLNIKGQFNTAELQAQLNGADFIATVQIQQQLSQGTGFEEVDRAVQDPLKDPLKNPAKVIEEQRAALEQLKQKVAETQKQFDTQKASIDSNTTAVSQLTDPKNFGFEKVNEGFRNTVGEIRNTASEVGTATETQLNAITAKLPAIKEQIGQLLTDGIINEDTQELLNSALDNIENSIAQRKLQLPLEPKLSEEFSAAIQSQLDIIGQGINAANLGITPERAAEIMAPIGQQAQVAADTIQTAFTNASQNAATALSGIQPVLNAISTAGAVAQMRALETAALAALAAARAAAAAGQAQHFGGPIYKAKGGPVGRGVDTRMVAMEPGEVITNKRSSQKFFSELHAINAGQSPQFREHGGPVTNVGDIHMNVNTTQSVSENDARTLVTALRREISRRKTSKPL